MNRHLRHFALIAVAIVTVMLAGTALAAEGLTFKRFLFPVLVPQAVPGAHGSLWSSEAWFSYGGSDVALVAPVPVICPIQCVFPFPVLPGLPPLQFLPDVLLERSQLMHVESSKAASFTFSLRVRDESRESDSAGTEIPVVSEDEILNKPIRLLNVPVAAKFRDTLRIYALPEVADPVVEIRYLRMQDFGQVDVVLLRTDRVTLSRRPATEVEQRIGIQGLYPSYAEINNFDDFPELVGEARGVWIEVVPVTPNLRIWAFASVTNDDTQQFTVVSP